MENLPVSNKRIPIRGVIFDYGNVICHQHLPSDVEKMAQVAGIPVPRFREVYWKYRLGYDRADFTTEAYWQIVAREDDRTLSPEQIAELTSLDTEGWTRVNSKTIAWVEQLRRAGLRLGLLSNMSTDLRLYLADNSDWLSLFDHTTFSCDVRLVKPDAAIYRTCLDSLGLAPQEALFLDDLPANIEAAANVGLHAMLFDDMEKTTHRVGERFDIPLPDFSAVVGKG